MTKWYIYRKVWTCQLQSMSHGADEPIRLREELANNKSELHLMANEIAIDSLIVEARRANGNRWRFISTDAPRTYSGLTQVVRVPLL